ncbi:hypothetical protein PF001_g28371 [Phytophthora fragariae]|uniref:Uncharacterized protein n=1 Tax=Phytophthora fragariae TaxID=53985 RepID=A0A6A4B9S5_9STRA|nr:hypothetical protein PF003_g36890 [Phytophthora fragariae]KAE9271452.1 hypothetical protein PF001_g28371 [Phytophthora fragariae]
MEWNAGTLPAAGAKWEGVARFTAADVTQWLQEHGQSTNTLVVEDKV